MHTQGSNVWERMQPEVSFRWKLSFPVSLNFRDDTGKFTHPAQSTASIKGITYALVLFLEAASMYLAILM